MCSHVILKSVLTWINCLNLTFWCINLQCTDMFIILSTFEICLVAISLLLWRHSIFTFFLHGVATNSLSTSALLCTQMASATATYGQKETSDQNFDYMFKILIIGNSSVGKTSFLFRYADDSFTPAFVSTVGIDFKVKTIYRNDKRIKLQIWVRHVRVFDFPGGSRLNVITLSW